MDKIMFLNIFRSHGAGGEIYLQRLISNLAMAPNCDIRLISPPCQLLDSVSVPILRIHGVAPRRGLGVIIDGLRSIYEINRILCKEKPDVLIINGDRAILLSPFLGFVRQKIGVKHMLIAGALKYILNFVPFLFLNKIVTISRFHIENYLAGIGYGIFKSKIKLIYNAVDTYYFCEEEVNRTDRNVLSFLEIASLEKRKGQEDLIRAFYELACRHSNIELHFVGAGEDSSHLLRLVAEHQLTDKVYFHGFQSDVKSYILKSSVVVLPSYDEGLPFVLLEAMSCGRPVISTRIAGIPEIIDQGKNGFLYTPGDIPALTECMEEFVIEKQLTTRLGKEARKKIIETFDQKRWIEEWKKCLGMCGECN